MVRDFFESIFEVKQSKHQQSGLSIFLSFVLFLVLANSLFIVFAIENKVYGEYMAEYSLVKIHMDNYYGEYPLKSSFDLHNQKSLYTFLKENNMSYGQSFYFIDTNGINTNNKIKRTYVWDAEYKRIYTLESVVYRFKRWNAPLSN